jgi:hypothetical protein
MLLIKIPRIDLSSRHAMYRPQIRIYKHDNREPKSTKTLPMMIRWTPNACLIASRKPITQPPIAIKNEM